MNNEKTTASKGTRRDCLKKSAAATFGFTLLPAYLTSARAENNPQRPPSQRVNLGCIGVGGIAIGVLPGFFQGGRAVPVAFAEIDYGHNRMKRKDAGIVEQFPDVPRYHDFRVMLEERERDIDAVVISTPDHNHFVSSILAMSMGKHVYTQKPLTHTFEESEILMRAEKKFGVVTQMGNQGHTSSGATQFKQMVENGILDDIVKIEAWKSASLWFMLDQQRVSAYPKGEKIPESLKSWENWVGSKEMKPFSAKYHPFEWRGFYIYGGGMFGDWGAHLIDFAHDYLKLGLPTQITPVQLFDHNEVIFPRSSHIKMKFPARGPGLPEVELDWKAGDDFQSPAADEAYCDRNEDGSINKLDLDNAGTFLHRKQGDYLVKRGSHGAPSRVYPAVKMKELYAGMKAPRVVTSHAQNFIQACMGEGKTTSPFSIGGLLTQTFCLGCIAERLNEPLSFDPAAKQFIGNDKANFLLKGPEPRSEWAGFYKMT